ncbi:3'-5' exonuclease [Spiromyces aspiralis]|uniref:3'-5' exonuclease n=1 Tax=Spiromyces aspiralis TaxID=68401 RepID=A0ACC1HI00_9FUNG|nr:3'-5' exonuclease [Spiromyces aspiralis]
MENWKAIQKTLSKVVSKSEKKSKDKDKSSKKKDKSEKSDKPSEKRESKKGSKSKDKGNKDKKRKREDKETSAEELPNTDKESSIKSKKSSGVGKIVDAILFKDKEKKKSKKRKSSSKSDEEEKEGRSKKRKVDTTPPSVRSDLSSDTDSDSGNSSDDDDDKSQVAEQPRPLDDVQRAAEEAQALALAHLANTDEKMVEAEGAPRDADSWFDQIAQKDFLRNRKKEIEREGHVFNIDPSSIVPEEKKKAIGKYLAMDCEMVGVGPKGARSMLARVSLVNYYGITVLDEFVKPQERVTDYRTWVSGIRPKDIANGVPFKEVQKRVADLLEGRILVGHAVHHDLAALLLSHPASMTRDTSTYNAFRQHVNGRTPGLKRLAEIELGLKIQEGEHSSVTDAKITMLLYRKARARWEKSISLKARVKEKRRERSVAKRQPRQIAVAAAK